ncbi:MAG: NADPH-dependent glutamate synthase [Clostridia bacterium]
MANMSATRVPMPEQDPNIRNKNFDEVSLGYTEEQAMEEASRCIGCKNRPCVSGCPVGVPIPEFIAKIAAGDFRAAINIIKETNALPAVCGRVCPQESQCERHCVRGIKGEPVAIGRLERFAADWAMKNANEMADEHVSNGHKVAVVGAGPAGLTCAGELARRGYDVTIYEAFHTAGGVLVYGIPEFRLPKAIVAKEIAALGDVGVKIVKNFIIGRTATVDDLFEDGFEAVFVGSGAGLPSFMNVPGENLNGVYSANEFLTRINLMKAYDKNYDTPMKPYKNVAVIGGGNVAMDAARSAKRLGAENVYIVYRRGEAELPARLEEIHHAKEEGIIFKLLTAPVEVYGSDNGWVTGLKCTEMQLGEPDSSGRRRPVTIEGSEFDIPLDCIIVAIGTSPNPLIHTTTPGLDTNKWGCIIVESEETGKTTKNGVFAGGDAVTGAATVILAMGAGKGAADAIDEFIKSK